MIACSLNSLLWRITESQRRMKKDPITPFKKGMCVQFKPGNADPDSGISIAGWSGRIKEVDTGNQMLEIELDSVTLINLPARRNLADPVKK